MQKYTLNIRILTWLILLFCLSAKSQVLQWSNPTKLKGAAVYSKVLGENEYGVFLLRYRNRFYSKNVIIEQYNHHLALEQSKTFDLKNARLIKLYLLENSILFVKSSYYKANQSNQLIAQHYSFDFKAQGEPILLAEADVREYGNRGNFRLRISDDHSFYSLVFSNPAENGDMVIHHKLFDSNLNEIHLKSIQLPIDYEDFIIQDFLVTNQGDVAFLTNSIYKQRRRISNMVQSMYYLRGDELSDYVVTDSLEIKAIDLVYDRVNDKPRLVGFFGTKDEYGIVGSLFFEIDDSLNCGLLNTSLFAEELIDEISVNDRNNGTVSEGFQILKTIPRNDGGTLCIAEQKEIATEDDIVMVNGIPQSTSKNVYNFNEIVVLNYDSSGFLDWSKVITKNQTTINDGGYFSSAVVYVGDKYIQLLYNDQLRNTGDIMQYTIYNNGKMESNKLLKTELDYVAIIPAESKQVSSNKVVISTSKNRRFALLKLIYD
ncbi:MAG: hypothetical protein KJP21_03505 [Bacteroidia bacterium]|nr:hypothetical protein [Bacteroidia bacterium]NNJ56757.1 hypothetical protein [Bacteroidia bacterium]